MKPYNLIILAGGHQQALQDVTGIPNKALIPIHGKPMIEWVLDAFRGTGRIANIVVAGSSQLDHHPCMSGVRKRIHSGASALESVINAVGYTKARLSADSDTQAGYLISFCDAVFLTPSVINAMINRIESSDADIGLHYVERETYVAANLPAERTFIPIDGKQYTGTTLYYVRQFRDALSVLMQLVQSRRHRKSPEALLKTLGCHGMSLPEIERHLSTTLSSNLRLFISEHPEAGMDVDKPVDLELAREWLASAGAQQP